MKNLIVGLLFMASSGLVAQNYPVDDDIDDLKWKISYLETLKSTLLSERCSVTVRGNKVILGAGALRSHGLVMGITNKNPGNYWAYHQAPKPQFLQNLLTAKDAVIVGSRLGENQEGKFDTLAIFIAEPVLLPETGGLWHYMKSWVTIPFPEGKSVSKSAKLQDGSSWSLDCN